MTVPALTVGGRDRCDPEIRDRILAKLQTEMDDDEATYRLMTPARLRALAEIEAADWPVVSLYLQLGPDRRVGGRVPDRPRTLQHRVGAVVRRARRPQVVPKRGCGANCPRYAAGTGFELPGRDARVDEAAHRVGVAGRSASRLFRRAALQ